MEHPDFGRCLSLSHHHTFQHRNNTPVTKLGQSTSNVPAHDRVGLVGQRRE